MQCCDMQCCATLYYTVTFWYTIPPLQLDGELLVRAVPGAAVTLRHVVVVNAGSILVPLTPAEVESHHTPEAQSPYHITAMDCTSLA